MVMMGNSKKERELLTTKFFKSFSRLCDELIDEFGITFKDLSDLSGIDNATVVKMRKMVSPNLSWFAIYKMAKFLDITMESLVEGTYDYKKIKIHLADILKKNNYSVPAAKSHKSSRSTKSSQKGDSKK